MSAVFIPPLYDQTRARCAELVAQLRPLLETPTPDATNRFRSAHEELADLVEDMASTEVVDCLVLIAHYFYLGAQPVLGLSAAAKAVAFAKLIENKNLLRRALSLRGLMYVETGNLPSATESLLEALQVAKSLGNQAAESPAWNNLGLALQNSAQYGDALACFERAAALASDSPEFRPGVTLALANIANCAIHLHDVKRGIQAVRAAIDINPNPTTANDCFARVIAESQYARLLLEVGEIVHAEQHGQAAREFAARAPSARAEYAAAITSGLIEVNAKRTDVGLTRLKRSLEHARVSVKSEVRDALSACIAGYEAAGQPDVALVYLHELLAMNREAKSAQVLMHHSEYIKQVEQPAFGPGSIDVAMANQRGKLRIQLGERELMRNRILLLEQQSVAAELHDDTTGEHCYRVGRLASILGKEIGLEDDVCFLIDLAARLHDIGKLVVPDAILLKPGKLTPGEREIMQTHTTAGADILAKSNVPQMHIAEEIARHHHERWDGTGYPTKLAGTAIPIAARVSALADVFDALTHKRPYKEAWKVSDALAEIASLKGKQFDPELTDIFLELVPRLQREHGDLDEFLAVEAKNSPFIKARKQIAEALKGTDPETTLFEMRR
ncbi:MAG TPA: HD domain-containing protein [Burkholderiaceae bacterium]|nr:HD domain-containing protein [Burkholderiaceae bacterium]HQR69714.1 HD domain-containing protein [Burkholderiaceae bacterium]